MRTTLSFGPTSETVLVMLSMSGTVVWTGEYAPDVRLSKVMLDITEAKLNIGEYGSSEVSEVSEGL